MKGERVGKASAARNYVLFAPQYFYLLLLFRLFRREVVLEGVWVCICTIGTETDGNASLLAKKERYTLRGVADFMTVRSFLSFFPFFFFTCRR